MGIGQNAIRAPDMVVHHFGFFLEQGAARVFLMLDNLRQQQASSLAYFDCFWVFAMIMIFLVPVVLLMKRSVAEKGARVGLE